MLTCIVLLVSQIIHAQPDPATEQPPPVQPEAPESPPPTPNPDSSAEPKPEEASESPDEASPPATPVYETIVKARRPMSAASSATIRDRDFLLRPHPRPADILQVTPGLFVVQHAGGGKANQYFLRGFDIDHGTDLALSVDGVPVNLVSHGHGQGYADLNWLIPEVVRRIEVTKGPYFAQYGDFATAGAINLVTQEGFNHSSVTLGGGMFDTARALVIASPEIEGARPFVAAEVYHTNGPFERGEDLDRYSLFAKVTRDLAPNQTLSLALTAYGAGWHASGQIPSREVRAGRLSRFGTEDPTDGGNTQRQSVYGQYRARGTDSEFNVLAYLVRYQLALYSNFTFFSRDPVNGDQIEQDDVRTFGGIRTGYRFGRNLGDIVFDTTLGAQVRSDAIANALHYTRQRERLSTVVDARIGEVSVGPYAQEEITWTRWLRTVVGLRADYFGFDVTDAQEELATIGTKTSGARKATLVSPKASAIISPLDDTDIYLNFGRGFHSNDARGVVRGTDAVTPLTAGYGYEVGARSRFFERLDVAAAGFLLDLDSELVWVGDEGTTEARGPTRRLGIEFEGRLEILPWLFADTDVTWSRATFVENAGNANAVALAPTWILSGGVSARRDDGIYGRLGAVFIADRPATEDEFLVAEGFARVDATLGYHRELFDVGVSVQNVLDTDWNEAQFANVSRLRGETSPASCPAGTRGAEADGTFAGCDDLHFTPGAPINIQASASLFF